MSKSGLSSSVKDCRLSIQSNGWLYVVKSWLRKRMKKFFKTDRSLCQYCPLMFHKFCVIVTGCLFYCNLGSWQLPRMLAVSTKPNDLVVLSYLYYYQGIKTLCSFTRSMNFTECLPPHFEIDNDPKNALELWLKSLVGFFFGRCLDKLASYYDECLT